MAATCELRKAASSLSVLIRLPRRRAPTGKVLNICKNDAIIMLYTWYTANGWTSDSCLDNSIDILFLWISSMAQSTDLTLLSFPS